MGHQGPLKPSDPNHKGSSYNVRLRWEDRSETDEPLGIVGKDDATTCADHARKHGLLDTPGWKFLRKHGCQTQKLQQMLEQARATAAKNAPIFKFGVQIPHHEHEARTLETKQGHTRWTNAENTEQECLHDCSAFQDCGKGAKAPAGYKKIRVCYVCDVKHGLRHCARMVAGGHLTEHDLMASCAGVVSLRSTRLAILIDEMSVLVCKAGDTGSAYLEAKTKEKVQFN